MDNAGSAFADVPTHDPSVADKDHVECVNQLEHPFQMAIQIALRAVLLVPGLLPSEHRRDSTPPEIVGVAWALTAHFFIVSFVVAHFSILPRARHSPENFCRLRGRSCR